MYIRCMWAFPLLQERTLVDIYSILPRFWCLIVLKNICPTVSVKYPGIKGNVAYYKEDR